VLVAGLPRSGSTWLARVLTSARGVAYVDEPDNQWRFPFAFRAKRGLRGRFHPLIRPHEEPNEYAELWTQALAVGPNPRTAFSLRERVQQRAAMRLFRLFDRGSDADRSRKEFMRYMRSGGLPPHLAAAERLAVPRRPVAPFDHVVAKSVYAVLALDWIAARFPVEVVVLVRGAYNVLSSWQERGWLGEPGDDMMDEVEPGVQRELSRETGIAIPPVGSVSSLARGACFYALLTRRLLAASDDHPEWHVVSHERLCQQPRESIRELALDVGLPWSAASDRALVSMDRPGTGFEPRRKSARAVEAWRDRLTADHVREIDGVLDGTGIDPLAPLAHHRERAGSVAATESDSARPVRP
jgi:hypothetical protein